MALTLIQSICTHIAEGNIEGVGELLPRLALSRLGPEPAQKLLCVLLSVAADANRVRIVRLLIGYFDIQRPGDPLPVLTQLLALTYITSQQLGMVLACFPEKSPVDYYIDLMNLHNETTALQIIPVLQSFYPHVSPDDWLFLLKQTDPDEDSDETEHPLLRAFFSDQVRKTGRSSKCPSWVRQLPDVPIPVIDLPLPTVDAAVTLLLEKMNKDLVATADGESVDLTQLQLVRSTLIHQYCLSTVTEKLAMLRDHIPVPEYDDSVHFREYGPVNTQHTVQSEPHNLEHQCGKYGGCRMLLCTEFELADEDLLAMEEHQVESDWWKGECDGCNKSVARHHALRMPLFGGGWRGCYCSLECLKKPVDVNDLSTGMMIGRMMEQLECFGIRDR